MRQLFHFVRYFVFIAFNHTPVLAFRILYDEIRGELKYKLNTTGIKAMKNLKRGGAAAAQSKEYMPSNYVLLEKALAERNRYPHNKTFLDIGCGKGRTLFVAAHFGFEQISGVEFFEPYCCELEKKIAEKKSSLPSASLSVICADAASYHIPDAVETILFNNPFSEVIMKKVVQQILKSLRRTKRDLFIIYISPVDKQLFIDAGFKEVYAVKRFNYIEVSVLRCC
jgi:SAM-dependent methyltransferase